MSIGVHPESMREDDAIFGAWAADIWPGWNSGWIGSSGNIFVGDVWAGLDLAPTYLPAMWTYDIHWGGSKQQPYNIKGTIRDNNGNIVIGATVELWLASAPVGFTAGASPASSGGFTPEVLVQTTISNADGYYSFQVPDTTTKYFIVAYTGAAGGVSARNLVGS
jgi:hypothetical protein